MRYHFWILLISLASYSQQAVPLQQIFEQIAEKDGVRFSYIAEELAVYRLAAPNASLALPSKLAYIEKNTRLKIEMVAKNYYTVYNDKRMDKPLCGFLIDSQTNQPIENAAVSMPELGIVTASDANGYFELPLKPNTISILHMGYQSRQLSPQELYVPDCPKIQLVVVVQQLSEIATQRYLATGISKNPLGTVTVKPNRFGILPGLTEPDVLQTMQQLPGVTSVDETVSNINVRGGTHDQNLFLWNGIRMFQTGHFFGLISAFNPMLATQITIAKNGSSAFLGESVSSSVDMTSHTKMADSCYNAASLDMINANFFSKIKLSDNATIQAAGRRTFTDFVKTPAFKAYEDRVFQNNRVTDLTDGQAVPINSDQDFYFYDFSMQYHQRLGNHEVIIGAIGIENEVDFYQQDPIATKNSFLSQRNFGGSVNWKSHWNEKNRSDVQAYFSWYDLRSRNEADNQRIEQQNRVYNKGIRLRHSHHFSEKISVDAGYQFDETSIKNKDLANNPSFFREIIEVSRSHAVIAESRFTSENEKTQILAGVRGNYFEKFDLILIEPRLAVTQTVFRGLKIDVLAEMKSQTLSQIIDLQQDFLGIEKRRWTLANEQDIPVQKSRQASIGFTYYHNGWLVTVDNFYKQVLGISSKSQGFNNQYEFIAASGDCRVLGSELLLQKSFAKCYSWISYTYNDNRYDFKDFSPSGFVNNNSISHAIGWAGIYEWQRLRLALGARWHSGSPYTAPVGYAFDPNPINSKIQYGTANAQRLEDFFQMNFSASHRWDLAKNTALSASISLWNIFDKKNKIGRYYRINPLLNTAESVDTYALGFTPNVGLKIVF